MKYVQLLMSRCRSLCMNHRVVESFAQHILSSDKAAIASHSTPQSLNLTLLFNIIFSASDTEGSYHVDV